MKVAQFVAVAATRGVLLTALTASFAGAQSQTWIRQLGTSDTQDAYAVAPDGAGGVYVGGVYVGGLTYGVLGGPTAGNSDAWIARYDGAGNQIWIRQLGSGDYDFLFAAAPDGAGGVYVGGSTDGSFGGPSSGLTDAWIARYDGTGNQIWIRQLGTIHDDYVYAVAPDGAGGVYVSGEVGGNITGGFEERWDAWIARYDGAGNQIWIQQFGTADYDQATAAAPDGAGGVFVSGTTDGSLGGLNAGRWDAWIARYDGTGNQTWNRQLGTSDDEHARAAAPDGAGGVFVSGDTRGSLGGPNAGEYDAWIARYDGAGNQSWIRQLGTSNEDIACAAAPDGAGGVYVSGFTEGDLGGSSAGVRDAWIARYDGAGNQTWIRQLGTSNQDMARAAAPDGAGGVYVGGRTQGSLGGPAAGSSDAWIARYGGSGSTSVCLPAVPNSTGQSGQLDVAGSTVVADNDFSLVASRLPMHSFGFFITSQTQGFVAGAGGSQGNLCLSGSIGRFVGPGQILNSGAAGTFLLLVDLNALPTPLFSVAVQPGETWYFQGWHRDANPAPTSNFTDRVVVTFR